MNMFETITPLNLNYFGSLVDHEYAIYDNDQQLQQKKNYKLKGLEIHSLSTFEPVLLHIRELNLSHQRLRQIQGIHRCSNLESINVSFNKLKRLPYMASLTSLRCLNVSHNKLQTLSQSVLHSESSNNTPPWQDLSTLENLTHLNASFNCLQDLRAVSTCPRLQEVLVLHNQIYDVLEVAESISNMRTLTKLAIVGCPCVSELVKPCFDTNDLSEYKDETSLLYNQRWPRIHKFESVEVLSPDVVRALLLSSAPVSLKTLVLFERVGSVLGSVETVTRSAMEASLELLKQPKMRKTIGTVKLVHAKQLQLISKRGLDVSLTKQSKKRPSHGHDQTHSSSPSEQVTKSSSQPKKKLNTYTAGGITYSTETGDSRSADLVCMSEAEASYSCTEASDVSQNTPFKISVNNPNTTSSSCSRTSSKNTLEPAKFTSRIAAAVDTLPYMDSKSNKMKRRSPVRRAPTSGTRESANDEKLLRRILRCRQLPFVQLQENDPTTLQSWVLHPDGDVKRETSKVGNLRQHRTVICKLMRNKEVVARRPGGKIAVSVQIDSTKSAAWHKVKDPQEYVLSIQAYSGSGTDRKCVVNFDGFGFGFIQNSKGVMLLAVDTEANITEYDSTGVTRFEWSASGDIQKRSEHEDIEPDRWFALSSDTCAQYNVVTGEICVFIRIRSAIFCFSRSNNTASIMSEAVVPEQAKSLLVSKPQTHVSGQPKPKLDGQTPDSIVDDHMESLRNIRNALGGLLEGLSVMSKISAK